MSVSCLLPMCHIIKWLVLVLMFVFAGMDNSVGGLCAVGCGGGSYSRGGCGYSSLGILALQDVSAMSMPLSLICKFLLVFVYNGYVGIYDNDCKCCCCLW